MKTREVVDEVDDYEIEGRDEAAEQQHRDDHDQRGISQLLEPPNAFVLRFQGHDAFPSSARTSPIKFFVFVIMRTFQKPGQEGLEPPTDGFGDRYSTN